MEKEKPKGLKKGTKVHNTIIGEIKKGRWGEKDRPFRQNRISDIRGNAKRSTVSQAMMEVLPTDLDDNKELEKHMRIKQLFKRYLDSKTTGDLYTEIELENLAGMLKLNVFPRVLEKTLAGEILNKNEREMLRLFKDTITDYHRLAKGDKTIIHKFDFKSFRDEAMKDNAIEGELVEDDDNPGDN